ATDRTGEVVSSGRGRSRRSLGSGQRVPDDPSPLRGREAGHSGPAPRRTEDERRPRATGESPSALPVPPPAIPRRPRVLHARQVESIRPDAQERGAPDGRPEFHAAHSDFPRRGPVPADRRAPAYGAERRDLLRSPVRHGPFRVPGQAPGGERAIQRRDGLGPPSIRESPG